MEIRLKPEQETIIKSLITAGEYSSCNDAIAAAIQLLNQNVSQSHQTTQQTITLVRTSQNKNIDTKSCFCCLYC
ncbi:MAG: type II toxin-antitoxin system ParD family antitoxin [Prochloraceae cyanobacterium]